MLLANPFKPDLRVKREALSLSGAGHKVTILAWDRECRFPKEEVLDNVRIRRFHVAAPYGRFLRLVPGFARFYAKAILNALAASPDVIHCHDMDTLLPGIVVSLLTGSHVVYDMHESYPDFISTFAPSALVKLLRLLEPGLLRRAGLVIVTSTMIGEIARRGGAKKVVPVMNCFDPFEVPEEERRRMRESLLGEGKFLIVYIGGFFAGRGLEELVRAVSKVEGVKLFMGGYGPLEGDLKLLARDLGIEKRVVFGGEVDPSMVPKYDAAADLLVAMYKGIDPNNLLTIPNKYFESIASGRPILVSKIGEKSRLVTQEGNGIALDPEDVEAVAGTIRRLVNDSAAYERLAKAAKSAQRRYSWSRMSATLVAAYEELLRQDARNSSNL